MVSPLTEARNSFVNADLRRGTLPYNPFCLSLFGIFGLVVEGVASFVKYLGCIASLSVRFGLEFEGGSIRHPCMAANYMLTLVLVERAQNPLVLVQIFKVVRAWVHSNRSFSTTSGIPT